MIQFSSDAVSGNTREALLLVAFLLIFAVSARYADHAYTLSTRPHRVTAARTSCGKG